MNIDDKLIDYLQGLTRLELTDDERESTKLDLKKMLEYVSVLTDTSSLSMMEYEENKFTFISETELRPDEIEPSLNRTDALKNASRRTDEYFVTDKTVE